MRDSVEPRRAFPSTDRSSGASGRRRGDARPELGAPIDALCQLRYNAPTQVCSDERKYARNALLFSLGVSVAGDRLPAASAACASAARRLAETRAESSHPTST